MKYFPKVIWEKIYLSPLNIDDAEVFVKWMCDSRISNNITATPNIPTVQWEKERIESQKSNKNDRIFAIIKKDWDELLGTIWLHHINFINQSAELWIFIWNYDELNKWYGTDAIKALLWFWYNTLNLYNIFLWVKSYNERAIACYKKCGFRDVWKLNHCEYVEWKWYDLNLMESLKPNREKFK